MPLIQQTAKKYIAALRDVSLKNVTQYPSSLNELYHVLYTYLENTLMLDEDIGQLALIVLHQDGLSFRYIHDTLFKNPTEKLFSAIANLLTNELLEALFKREDAALKICCEKALTTTDHDFKQVAIQAYIKNKIPTHSALNFIQVYDKYYVRLSTAIVLARQYQSQGKTVRFQCSLSSAVHTRTIDFLFSKDSARGSCVMLDTADCCSEITDILLNFDIDVHILTSIVPALPGGLFLMPGVWSSFNEAVDELLKKAEANPKFQKHLGFSDKCILIQVWNNSDQQCDWYVCHLRAAGRPDLNNAIQDLPGISQDCWQQVELPLEAEPLIVNQAAKQVSIDAVLDLENLNDPEISKLLEMIDSATCGDFFTAIMPQKDKTSCAIMSGLMAVEASKCDVHQLCADYKSKQHQNKHERLRTENAEHKNVFLIPWSVMPPNVLKIAQSGTFYTGHSDSAHPQHNRLLHKYLQTGQANFVQRAQVKIQSAFKAAVQSGDFKIHNFECEKQAKNLVSSNKK